MIQSFKEHYSLNECSLYNIICNEKWIKFSKTGDELRIYNMDFYCLTEVDDINKIIYNDKIKQVYLKLDEISIAEAIETRKLEGIEIVENIVKILSDEELCLKIVKV
ncbi:MAG TPA: hypothetical protein DEG71_11210 [Clostridiales bacterium]|nr:hypothetical protein [Clostridiales bacterium]